MFKLDEATVRTLVKEETEKLREALGATYCSPDFSEMKIRFSNAQRTWAQITCAYRGKEVRVIELMVSRRLENTDEKFVRNTIMHEINHAQRGCQDHGAIWKSNCVQVMRKFPGQYDLSRCSSYDKPTPVERKRVGYIYTLYCPICDKELCHYTRFSPLLADKTAHDSKGHTLKDLVLIIEDPVRAAAYLPLIEKFYKRVEVRK